MTQNVAESSGVPLRAVVGMSLLASLLSRGIAPALPGLSVGMEGLIGWTSRAATLCTLLAATGIVAGLLRLASGLVAERGVPPLLRWLGVPTAALGAVLLLLASFRPLTAPLSLALGVSAALVGIVSARAALPSAARRATAISLGAIALGGLVHVLARKYALDASEAASVSAFRSAQIMETVAAASDVLALAVALIWIYKRARAGRVLLPLLLLSGTLLALLSRRGSLPGAWTPTVLLSRVLEPFSRGPAALLPDFLASALDSTTLLTAFTALIWARSELGTVLAAALIARGALDVPLPALLLELGALYLPFASAAKDFGAASQLSPLETDRV